MVRCLTVLQYSKTPILEYFCCENSTYEYIFCCGPKFLNTSQITPILEYICWYSKIGVLMHKLCGKQKYLRIKNRPHNLPSIESFLKRPPFLKWKAFSLVLVTKVSFLSEKLEFIALLLALFKGSLKRNAIPCTCLCFAAVAALPPCYIEAQLLQGRGH